MTRVGRWCRILWLLSVVLGLMPIADARAHEIRPGLLQMTEQAEGVFDVLWRIPARGDRVLALEAGLPDACEDLLPPSVHKTPAALEHRWRVACSGGLAGETLVIDGLRGTMTDVLARIEYTDGGSDAHRLTPDAPAAVLTGRQDFWQVSWAYLKLGTEHILLGIDHLLFVAALMMLVTGWRRLVGTVTAFTLAHSITLAGATLGLVSLPQALVEALIALSIVFVAAEIVHGQRGRPGLTARMPWLVAFTFGLLHGFGFAGALREVGLPEHAVPQALLFFNVGVEIGQLLFIAVLLALVAVIRRLLGGMPRWGWQVPAYAIGSVAAFWTIERTTGFWG